MSERMNKEQAIEQIKNIKEYIINPHQAEPQSMVFKQTQREKRLQALDIAIDSLEREELSDDFKKTAWEIATENKTLRADNEWVDVRDRLPSESDYYLITAENENKEKFIEFWFYAKGMEWANKIYNSKEQRFIKYKVIAWKPLPKPYERKE